MNTKILLLLFVALVSCEFAQRDNGDQATPALRIRASTLKSADTDDSARRHRLLHDEIEQMEGEKRKATAKSIEMAEKEREKQEAAASKAAVFRRFRPRDADDEDDAAAAIEAEIAAKKAYLKRLRLEGEAAKEEALNEERVWKLRNIEKSDKKKKTDKKFDAWFENLFEKLWKEMFGGKNEGNDVIAQKLMNNPSDVIKSN